MNQETAMKILNIKKDELNKINLKIKYRKALLKYHPDKNKFSTNEQFIKVKEAYDYLLYEQENMSHIKDKYIYSIYYFIKKYIQNNNISYYEFNLNIKNLLNKDIYYFNKYKLHIPLWHNELYFPNKNIYIKMIRELEDYIEIDNLNNIHIYLEIKYKKIGDIIYLLNESISFLYDEELYNNKIKILQNIGIPKIKNNIYDHSELSNIIIHI